MAKIYVIGEREFWLWQSSESGYWYVYWYDSSGKRRRRTTKTKDRAVATKRMREFAAELEVESARLPTLKAYASKLLTDHDPCVQTGRYSDQTINAKKRRIEILTDWFGSDLLGATREADIERRLQRSGYSCSYQQNVMDAYSFVISRAQRDGCEVLTPQFFKPEKTVTRRDSLTPAEVRKLFPDTIPEILALYSEDGEDEHGLMFGLLYPHDPPRRPPPGEGRAIGRNQFYPAEHSLVVSRMLDRHNQLKELKKRKYGDSDVFRIVVLPAKTCELLQGYIEATEPSDYLFLYNKEPLRQCYISERWTRVLEKAEINTEGRKLNIQAGRSASRSMIEGWLLKAFFPDAMGH